MAQAALVGPFHEWVERQKPKRSADLRELKLVEGAGGLDALHRHYSKPLYVLMVLMGFILAIACANIAKPTFARASV